MQSAPFPRDEAARHQALIDLHILDSPSEAEFDALVSIASTVCGVPISLVSLIDRDRQWFKAEVGLPGVSETSRDVSFCAHAILGDDVFEVNDASRDPRFADNPLVVHDPHIRFYAGAPLRLGNGLQVGTLCVIDRQPRQLDPAQRQALAQLARTTVRLLEDRQALQWLAEREKRWRALCDLSPAPLGLCDPSGRLWFANPAWATWWGDPEPRAADGIWLDRLTPEDRAAAQAAWTRLQQDRQPFELMVRSAASGRTARLHAQVDQVGATVAGALLTLVSEAAEPGLTAPPSA